MADLVSADIGAALASQGRKLRQHRRVHDHLVHSQDIPKFMQYRTRLFSVGAYPPNTLLVIDRLLREELLLEVSRVAAV